MGGVQFFYADGCFPLFAGSYLIACVILLWCFRELFLVIKSIRQSNNVPGKCVGREGNF